MNLSALTNSEFAELCAKVAEETARRISAKKPTIEMQISRLPKKQRLFLKALWNAPKHRLKVIDLEKKVWGGKPVKSETVRRAVWTIKRTLEAEGIPLFIDSVKRKNGDIFGYKIKKIGKL